MRPQAHFFRSAGDFFPENILLPKSSEMTLNSNSDLRLQLLFLWPITNMSQFYKLRKLVKLKLRIRIIEISSKINFPRMAYKNSVLRIFAKNMLKLRSHHLLFQISIA